jgi:anti-sigma B factor antagonist
MDINTERDGSVTIVSIVGSLDALTSPQLNEVLEREIQAGRVKLVADFGKLEYISSAGLRVLLSAVKETRRRNGDVRLAAVQADVTKVMEMSGFISILKHYPDRAAAVASFAG